MTLDEKIPYLLPLKRAYNNYVKWEQQMEEKQPQDEEWQARLGYIIKLMAGISLTMEQLGYTMTNDELLYGFNIEQK